MKLFAEERQMMISEIIKEEASITVESLAERIAVSTVTIRKDLDILEKKGLIVRTFGGAMCADKLGVEQSYENKKLTMSQEKNQIAAEASKLVKDDMVILIDAGSTATELCYFLAQKRNLTVLTFNLEAAILLCNYVEISVIFIGGEVSAQSKSCTGAEVLQRLKNYYVDLAFIGCDGFNLVDGALTTSPKRSYIKQQAMDNANRKILLSTSDKYDKKALIKFTDLDKFDYLYFDQKNKQLNGQLKDSNLNYILV